MRQNLGSLRPQILPHGLLRNHGQLANVLHEEAPFAPYLARAWHVAKGYDPCAVYGSGRRQRFPATC